MSSQNQAKSANKIEYSNSRVSFADLSEIAFEVFKRKTDMAGREKSRGVNELNLLAAASIGEHSKPDLDNACLSLGRIFRFLLFGQYVIIIFIWEIR